MNNQIKKDIAKVKFDDPNEKKEPSIVYQKVSNKATPLLLIVILLLAGACFYWYRTDASRRDYYENHYSPINSGDTIELELDSPLVTQLYTMVKTTATEDFGNPNFDNNLKRYLAYRNLSHNSFYESNCNLFDNSMVNFACFEDDSFKPDAFKDSSLTNMLNIMFGVRHGIEHENITVGGTCLGGYEYIASRGEYVKGKCTRETLLTVSADKKLTKATSTGDKIYLEENVRYFTNNGQDNPESLKDGNYVYTFRLDENFNYIYESREFKG